MLCDVQLLCASPEGKARDAVWHAAAATAQRNHDASVYSCVIPCFIAQSHIE